MRGSASTFATTTRLTWFAGCAQWQRALGAPESTIAAAAAALHVLMSRRSSRRTRAQRLRTKTFSVQFSKYEREFTVLMVTLDCVSWRGAVAEERRGKSGH